MAGSVLCLWLIGMLIFAVATLCRPIMTLKLEKGPLVTRKLLPPPIPSPLQQTIDHLPTNLTDARNILMSIHHFLYAGPPSYHEIALTFDDGPTPEYTEHILTILRQAHIKANFFTLGKNVKAYPQIVRHIYKDGHLIGNHTWNHPELSTMNATLVKIQMQETSQLIAKTIGAYPQFFRPPYGSYNYTTLQTANQMGLSTVIWNIDPNDWRKPGSTRIFTEASKGKNGAIILLHDGGGDRSQTVQALPQIIKYYKQKGFQFVTLKEMIAHFPNHQIIETRDPHA